ncbi:uncharacterized protein PRCAT00002272001 [Priceomyces carsonii]|uniref:uncharacterized protein n=1 Tax=Priceomyces carsonii TaxID=28549 RepID=UPI002ED81258|nr:unnamed protein product [Priceomyces carsonii]
MADVEANNSIEPEEVNTGDASDENQAIETPDKTKDVIQQEGELGGGEEEPETNALVDENVNSETGEEKIADNIENDTNLNTEEPQEGAESDEEQNNIYSIQRHKVLSEERESTQKKNVRKLKKLEVDDSINEGFVPMEVENGEQILNETPDERRRRLLEERMELAMKSKTTRRRRADEDDLERMQDDKIDDLKDKMIKAANLDVEKNSQGQIATEKLKLLKEVTDVLSKADLAISILDNNLLEAVRLWLEPLPDASMPAYQVQKELIYSLTSLPIKTDHLVASGIGKVLVFYQRSKRTEPNLKKIVDRLIGDWTRPILNKSDSYKDRTIQFHEYNKRRFTNKLSSARRHKPKEAKTLYEESAERRNRAAIPSARTTAYKIAPKVDPSILRRQQNMGGSDERFKRLNQKLSSMNIKKKSSKKSGPSIEGRNLAI